MCVCVHLGLCVFYCVIMGSCVYLCGVWMSVSVFVHVCVPVFERISVYISAHVYQITTF